MTRRRVVGKERKGKKQYEAHGEKNRTIATDQEKEKFYVVITTVVLAVTLFS